MKLPSCLQSLLKFILKLINHTSMVILSVEVLKSHDKCVRSSKIRGLRPMKCSTEVIFYVIKKTLQSFLPIFHSCNFTFPRTNALVYVPLVIKAFIRKNVKFHEMKKKKKNDLGFLIDKIWQILKRFPGTFC